MKLICIGSQLFRDIFSFFLKIYLPRPYDVSNVYEYSCTEGKPNLIVIEVDHVLYISKTIHNRIQPVECARFVGKLSFLCMNEMIRQPPRVHIPRAFAGSLPRQDLPRKGKLRREHPKRQVHFSYDELRGEDSTCNHRRLPVLW